MRSTLYRIDTPGPGLLATMAKPRGDDWLADEMAALAEAGIDILVCAMPAAERAEVGLSSESEAALAAGLTFVEIPIAELTVPDHRSIRHALDDLVDRFRAGASIVTHCRFGIGRASLLAASVLVLTGIAPEEAWLRVEAARGRPVPDTPEQRKWVAGLLQYAVRYSVRESGVAMFQPTDEARESIREWFVRYDALAERGAVEEMADLAVFPLNLATDVPGGHAAVASWSREEFVRTMSEVVGGGAAMESVRTPHFLSENLVVVITEAAVTVDGERQEMTYADVLVRTAEGWAFQTMVQGGWGHGWAPARRG